MKKTSILLVDDEPDFTRLTASFLQARGYAVDVAHTPQDAFVKIKQRPDVIIMDRIIRFNGRQADGLDLCKTIRQKKEWRHIPIIILTAMGLPVHIVEGLHMGADDYMSKPFHQEELVARIEAILRRKHLTGFSDQDRDAAFLELKNILKYESIETFFQPIFLFSSFEILGVEALNRPPSGSLFTNPEMMFRTALSMGQYHLLEALCWSRAIKLWKDFSSKVKLFLNCTPFLLQTDGCEKIIEAIAAIADPSDIVLEITELMEIKDYDLFFTGLDFFRKKGFRIAVDDVGHGYASLEMVARLRPDFLKIDKCFIQSAHQDMLKRDIIESIVFFSRKAGIITIAEGIETGDELLLTRQLGVAAGQGYLLARPEKEINFEMLAAETRESEFV